MDLEAFEQVATTFAAFHAAFAPLFGRDETQAHSEQYLRGLFVQHADRRNAENLAEAIAGASPRALQRFVTNSPWDDARVLTRLQRVVGAHLSAPDGVFVLDDSGFPKQGTHSVGVGPQYCGQVGKVTNCQTGVFLAYVSGRGHALVDARLYLPRAWIADPGRCRAAGVPGRSGWALWRRNLDGSELKHYLSNAPPETPLPTLGRVASWRWPVETEFATLKQEVGLDESEVRGWRGWHHHITMALLAGAFLLCLEQEWGGKDAPGHAAANQPHAAGTAAPARVDPARPAALAMHDTSAQRGGQTLACQPTPFSVL